MFLGDIFEKLLDNFKEEMFREEKNLAGGV